MTFDLRSFAETYTGAWCSQKAANVAACYSLTGSLTINDGAPSVGRDAITAAAQGFMTDFPDLLITMDGVAGEAGHAIYRWTLDGTNSGLGGTGASVHISGYEEWRISDDGLIAESVGHFDAADYQRQVDRGT
jgi:hypothetical protein